MTQCKAEIKLPGSTRSHRCPAPALPDEDYCPLHMVMTQKMKERIERSLPERLKRLLGG